MMLTTEWNGAQTETLVGLYPGKPVLFFSNKREAHDIISDVT